MRRAAALCLVVLAASGCSHGRARQNAEVPAGDPDRGHELIEHYGCGACHTIPGVRTATAKVGPPLDGFDRRRTIAGKLPNSPQSLMHWIRVPQQVVPGNDMPNLGVTHDEARDIAAYLLERT